jgi:hypothetical protein
MSNEADSVPNLAQPQRKRGLRKDIGRIKFNDRDEFALNWIGQQYAIRLDQLQWLLGQMAGKTAMNTHWITETAARNVVARWIKAEWVEAEQIRAREPLWIWPTRKGLRRANLPYNYRDIEQAGLDDLKHLYAINEIRLGECDEKEMQWVSERQLLRGVQHPRGRDLLHRPDAVLHRPDGKIIAIEAELSMKTAHELTENLLELVRGEEYLRIKHEYGYQHARETCQGMRGTYTDIWYFGPPKVRKQIQKERNSLISRGDLTDDEASTIFTCWYPVTKTDEEKALEEEQDANAFDDLEDTPSHEDGRGPEADGKDA